MSSMPPGFDAFDVFDDVAPTREDDLRDQAAAIINALAVGDKIKIGTMRFDIYKSFGLTKYLTKTGTKGAKFYRLDTVSLTPLVVSARQMLGGGSVNGEIIVEGPLSMVTQNL